MPLPRIPGFQTWRSKDGKVRVRHRKAKLSIDTAKYPVDSADFWQEVARIRRIADRAAAADANPTPGTLGGLIQAYFRSPYFAEKAPRTKAGYRYVAEVILRGLWDDALVDFTPPTIARIRDRTFEKYKRKRANDTIAFLSLLFNWGVELGHVAGNPAHGVKKVKRPPDAPDANRRWTDLERFAVLDAAPAHMKPVIGLCMYLGVRKEDAVAIRRNAYEGGMFDFKTMKAGTRVRRPAPAALRAILDAAPKHDAVTICATSNGTPWTPSGFDSSWQKFRRRLEKDGKIEPGLTIHGLRHTHGSIAGEIGHGRKTVAIALGHKSEASSEGYMRDAEMAAEMQKLTADLDADEARRRAEVSKIVPLSVKNGG